MKFKFIFVLTLLMALICVTRLATPRAMKSVASAVMIPREAWSHTTTVIMNNVLANDLVAPDGLALESLKETIKSN